LSEIYISIRISHSFGLWQSPTGHCERQLVSFSRDVVVLDRHCILALSVAAAIPTRKVLFSHHSPCLLPRYLSQIRHYGQGGRGNPYWVHQWVQEFKAYVNTGICSYFKLTFVLFQNLLSIQSQLPCVLSGHDPSASAHSRQYQGNWAYMVLLGLPNGTILRCLTVDNLKSPISICFTKPCRFRDCTISVSRSSCMDWKKTATGLDWTGKSPDRWSGPLQLFAVAVAVASNQGGPKDQMKPVATSLFRVVQHRCQNVHF